MDIALTEKQLRAAQWAFAPGAPFNKPLPEIHGNTLLFEWERAGDVVARLEEAVHHGYAERDMQLARAAQNIIDKIKLAMAA